jgi:hypothetical protein
LLGGGDTGSYRGFFRLLTEQHIPFSVSDNLRWIDDPSRRFDLVIAPSRLPQEVERYVRSGGRLLLAGTSPPSLPIGKVVGVRPRTQGYWRIQDRAAFPSLNDTDLIFLDGPFVELAPLDRPLLTLIPPAMFGPPEKVWSDKVETTIPGIVITDIDKGRLAYVPWDVGGLYYRNSSPAHAGLIADLIDRLLPSGRQLKTNAHPLIEITVMDQPARKRTLVHFVNGTGHSDTAYFPPVELRDIQVEFARPLRSATATALKRTLPVSSAGAYSRFTLPSLKEYEVVVVE